MPPGVPNLSPGLNAAADAAGLERARLARMAGQAHESEVFFRLHTKVVGAEAARARPEPSARSLPRSSDPALETAAAKAAAARARALAGGDLELATDVSEAIAQTQPSSPPSPKRPSTIGTRCSSRPRPTS